MLEGLGKYMKNHDYCFIRIAVGILFIVSGIVKLFIMGPTAVGQFFGGIGIPAPLFFAYLVGLVELLGGIAVLIGFWTRLAAILLSAVMLVAMFTAHLPDLLNWPGGFTNFWLRVVVFSITLTLVFKGAGKCCAIDKDK